MKKTILWAIMLFLLVVGSGFKQQSNVTLKIEVTNLETKAPTKVYVSVFYENDFLEKSIQTKSVNATGSKVAVTFDLPPGEYAVSTYQDINSNGKLDRYIIGKPKEPYGFSNNVKPFGPPRYSDCKFTLTNAPKVLSIALIN